MSTKGEKAAARAIYTADISSPSRDTIPCPTCGTTLSGCDFFTDAIGNLLPPRCPNRHRHGTGWRAFPEPSATPAHPTDCEDCGGALKQPSTGNWRVRCVPCAAARDKAIKAQWHVDNRERMKGLARERAAAKRAAQESYERRWRRYWQTKDGAA